MLKLDEVTAKQRQQQLVELVELYGTVAAVARELGYTPTPLHNVLGSFDTMGIALAQAIDELWTTKVAQLSPRTAAMVRFARECEFSEAVIQAAIQRCPRASTAEEMLTLFLLAHALQRTANLLPSRITQDFEDELQGDVSSKRVRPAARQPFIEESGKRLRPGARAASEDSQPRRKRAGR